jgi:hypothetical protein
MSVAHGAFEYVGTRPFSTEAASLTIIVGPITWVLRTWLGLHAIILWVMPRYVWGSDQPLSWTERSQVKKPSGEDVVPVSGAPWVVFCPPSLGLAGGRIEASTQCSREPSAYGMVAVTRMLFSHWYTSPTPSMEGASNASRSAATMTTFWLALAKVGSYHYICSLTMAYPVSNADSFWSQLANLAFMATSSTASRPHCCVILCLISSYRACCSGRVVDVVVCYGLVGAV